MNQVVIKEGEPIKEVYIIRSGEFEVSQRMSENKESHQQLTDRPGRK